MDLNGRPYFFWDYDITWKEIKEKLAGSDIQQKSWIASRMLEYARWEDIWQFFSIDEIRKLLPYMKMKPGIKKMWEYAVSYWSK